VADIAGPTHPYMTSAPGCWNLYGLLLARSPDWIVDRGTVQLRTDAYACQHATNPDPRNRQSVAVHLMSLCATFELGLVGGRTTALLGGWTHRPGGYPDLISDIPHGSVTVVDVVGADDGNAHALAVAAWARSAWNGWADHHTEIRELLAEYGWP
jgi:Family of unknown function (DUF5946)